MKRIRGCYAEDGGDPDAFRVHTPHGVGIVLDAALTPDSLHGDCAILVQLDSEQHVLVPWSHIRAFRREEVA